MALRRSGRAFERLLGGLQRSVGGSWRGLGCHVSDQDGSQIQKKLKKCCSKSQAVPQRFSNGLCVEDKQLGMPQRI